MLHGIPRSVEAGGLTFPDREDYLSTLKLRDGSGELDTAALIAIQRDWHSRGQNGCVFAMHAARQLSDQQWSYEVYDGMPDALTMQMAIESAVGNPENELASLLFPNVTSLEQLAELINTAVEAGCVPYQEAMGDVDVLRLRWRIGEVESWVIGFIPLDDVPVTRRAPFAELVFRTKQKSGIIHERLNNDPTQAHVADIDLGFGRDVTGSLLDKSTQRTMRLLGGEAARSAAHGAKAKTTYGIAQNNDLGLPEG